MTVAFDGLRGAGVATRTACILTGRARASHYRRLRPPKVRRPPIPQSQRREPTQALSPAERARASSIASGRQRSRHTGTSERWPLPVVDGRLPANDADKRMDLHQRRRMGPQLVGCACATAQPGERCTAWWPPTMTTTHARCPPAQAASPEPCLHRRRRRRPAAPRRATTTPEPVRQSSLPARPCRRSPQRRSSPATGGQHDHAHVPAWRHPSQ
jgi:hypothetical protein